MNLSGILGLAIATGIILGVILLGPTDTCPVTRFINVPSILLVVALAGGLELMAASARNVGHALWGIRVLVVNALPNHLSLRDGQILRDLSVRFYTAGLIGVLIGVVQLLASIDDWNQLWIGLAVSLLPLFTAFVLAEVILRPAAQRIGFLLDTPSP